MINIIFFSVDNVLNNADTPLMGNNPLLTESNVKGIRGFDGKFVRALVSSAIALDCKLVLFGDWKKYFVETDDLSKFLSNDLLRKLHGANSSVQFFGITPYSVIGEGIEVMNYVHALGDYIEDFVCIGSDISTFKCTPNIMRQYIETDNQLGLSKITVDANLPKERLAIRFANDIKKRLADIKVVYRDKYEE